MPHCPRDRPHVPSPSRSFVHPAGDTPRGYVHPAQPRAKVITRAAFDPSRSCSFRNGPACISISRGPDVGAADPRGRGGGGRLSSDRFASRRWRRRRGEDAPHARIRSNRLADRVGRTPVDLYAHEFASGDNYESKASTSRKAASASSSSMSSSSSWRVSTRVGAGAFPVVAAAGLALPAESLGPDACP